MKARHRSASIRKEWFLIVSILASFIFLFFGQALAAKFSEPSYLILILAGLFAAILGSALSVVRHAEHLAVRLGEPYGTLILTLIITAIEVVSISATMLHGANNPTLTRDTLFSVIMIILNGMVGLSLLVGAWRHREQHYNLRGANAYLGVIIPLAVLSLILPNFTMTTPGPTLSLLQGAFLAFISVSLYGAFLALQTGLYRGYFTLGDEARNGREDKNARDGHSLGYHVAFLIVFVIPVVFLAEQLAYPLDYLTETLHAPDKLGGLVIALLVAAPEAIGAIRAAGKNHIQRSMNIFLGSVLSTIGLTVPAMLIISDFIRRDIILGVEHTDIVMLLLTLGVSVVTFASGRTNVLQGVVHLILFASYLLLIFQG